MLSEKAIQNVEQTAAELKRRREHRPAEALRQKPQSVGKKEPSQADRDFAWARENLRFKGSEPMIDIANALRVLERHSDFDGRFRYNPTLKKVMDKGSVMLDWRVAEIVAILQERFLPEIPEDVVGKALIVHSNRVILKKNA